jgi:hypothetical protein
VLTDTLPAGIDYCGTTSGATPDVVNNPDSTTTLT